ncbi:uncharacterized protein CTHT_0035140 [Thermochaetoides thermophila DSM 1495]|uniref:Cytochrome P450 n=1 Tax=Chaetomium thermophilum (strain DSM 1495 / CBS 144.50 / IMI 039719) TaxID=759272 RepID=G0S6P7_CHATD|nr:hypothetical protein CTHT_0035140 [Thermochaetoides thermophila DSM 1495]EGS21649.1 hypothetical protein CTHT_0035140 [Thermochaetoides thermophila DSM 1495]
MDVIWTCRPNSWQSSSNPLRPPLMWWRSRIIREYFLPIVEEVVAQAADKVNSSEGPDVKTALFLATKGYVAAEREELANTRFSFRLDKDFISKIIPHFTIFILVGHGTTAATLGFIYYLLRINPSKLSALWAEYDAVLGPDPNRAASLIAANPTVFNSLPGQPGFDLIDPADFTKRYPTDGFEVHGDMWSARHFEHIFPRAAELLPKRFLPPESDPLHVRKKAFRPFSTGLRSCIRQELGTMKIRMILAIL